MGALQDAEGDMYLFLNAIWNYGFHVYALDLVFPVLEIHLKMQDMLKMSNSEKQQNGGYEGFGEQGKWGNICQGVQTSSYKINKFWGSLYSMAIIANNTVSYT